MRPTLPRAWGQKFCRFGALLVVVAACHQADPPVKPGPPLPAEPDVQVDTMDKECDGMIAALEAFERCPNATDEDRRQLRAWVRAARTSFAAGDQAKPDAQAQHVIALACHRATISVRNAIVRCNAGPAPKGDYGPDPRTAGEAD